MDIERAQKFYKKAGEFAAQVGPYLDEGDRADVAQFMAANEGALGLDLILFLMERKGVRLPAELRDTAYSLSAEIGLDLDEMRAAWPKV